MAEAAVLEFAAWVGIDWADKKHVWAMQVAGEARVQQGQLDQKPEAVEQFACELAQRFPGRLVAVGLEQSRGALMFMLTKYAHLVLYPIHPNTLDHYRKSFYPSGAKSDPNDASLALDLLRRHPERLRPFRPDTVETRTLQFLVEARREAVDDKTRYVNRLTSQLKMFFPQVFVWFDRSGFSAGGEPARAVAYAGAAAERGSGRSRKIPAGASLPESAGRKTAGGDPASDSGDQGSGGDRGQSPDRQAARSATGDVASGDCRARPPDRSSRQVPSRLHHLLLRAGK